MLGLGLSQEFWYCSSPINRKNVIFVIDSNFERRVGIFGKNLKHEFIGLTDKYCFLYILQRKLRNC